MHLLSQELKTVICKITDSCLITLQLPSCGCCVDIQHYAVYNIFSNVARLYKRILHCCCDVRLLFIMQVTTAIPLHISVVNCNFGMVIEITYGDLQEVGCGGMYWVEMVRIETVGGHLGLNEPSGSIK